MKDKKKVPMNQEEKNPETKKSKRALYIILELVCFILAVTIAVIGISYSKNQKFVETFYQVGLDQINGNIRIIQISDLHNCQFGDNNDDLCSRVEKLKPDIIVLTGDMIDLDDDNNDVAMNAFARFAQIAPTYMVYGNNEMTAEFDCNSSKNELDKKLGYENVNSGKTVRGLDGYNALKSQIEATGVKVLENEMVTLNIGGDIIDIYGILATSPSSFWEYDADAYQSFLDGDASHIKITLCHEPYIFEILESGSGWGDLIFCGHTHGGLVKVPYLGRLYEKEHGLFPKDGYIYGPYTLAQGEKLIVSGGLSNRGFPIRINNEPEIVITDLARY